MKTDKREVENKAPAGGVVSSVHPLASQAGVEILRRGGNVVDAAVTTALTMHVVAPAWSMLGGGAFIAVYLKTQSLIVIIDAREVAPKKVKTSQDIVATGYGAIGVPGCLSGYHLALQRYGTISLKDALQPAIRYAENGYEISRRMRDILLDNIDDAFDKARNFPATSEIYLKDGNIPTIVEKIVCADFAKTLSKIANGGPEVYYEGEISEAIASDIQSNGGFVSKEDLSKYEPRIREPLAGTYRGYEIFSVPPPSAGGGAIIESLNILENFDLRAFGHNTSSSIHVISEALKYAYSDNDKFTADPDYVNVPIYGIVSKDRAREIAGQIDLRKVSSNVSLHGADGFDSRVSIRQDDKYDSITGGTAHLSVIDKERNMVSITDSINYYFGSGVVINNTGILMNDTMRDFSLEHWHINSVEPGKRPRSWMSPTLVLKNGKPFLTLGSAGGPKIVSSVLQVIINVIDFNMRIEKAVQAPRFHCQGNEVSLESSIPLKIREELVEKGHPVKERDEWWFFGAVQAALVDLRTNQIYGAADPRRDGIAIKE